ncbi:uncharacterized protein BX663DRAFT_504926 [Cokeromyces recurvatus]|uniref:uncharacterized protein n=1 Tax=Cokeromyces recurvatus TaxID=90255 RepID=UPI0022212104|nr:uncharacterized protein BX663DRAFT_504926 [Cokeromyces recurvatus]KAI7904397.1 hypothetical protein BX663DRAFT_504926 [Cokeromyces recurvatus]
MIKNIGKLKQWTGEKFGSAKITLQTEDFQRLEVETERKRVAYEKLYASTLILHQQLLKRKISPEDNKSKRLVGDIFGVSLNNYGNEFVEETPLGIATINLGQAQSKIAAFQEEYADVMKSQYIEKLEEGLQLFKEYQSLRKKLESRRLDYDSKLSRLQKSKKEKPELEQEMQASKMKYEDSEYDVIQKMVSLQEFEDDHCEALQSLLDVQIEYFSRSLELLNDVKTNWTNPQSQDMYARSLPRRNPTILSRTLSNHSNSGDDVTSYNSGAVLSVSRSATTTMNHPNSPRRLSMSRSGSTTDTTSRRMPTLSRKSSSQLNEHDEQPPLMNHSSRINATPPTLPRRQSQASSLDNRPSIKNQRKAMYEFEGENADELSFHIGDIIQVLEEVDEGWWVGEIQDPHGTVRCGIFPVNYTESISAGPPMPARPVMTQSMSSNLTTTSHESDQSYNNRMNSISIEEEEEVEHSSPFGDSNRTASNHRGGFSYTAVRSPNNHSQSPTRNLSTTTTTTTTTTNHITPSTSPVPQKKPSSTTTKRAPPPPPPTLRSNSNSTTTNNTTRQLPPPPPPSSSNMVRTTPNQQVPANDYFEMNNNHCTCNECGCTEYAANLFKKGYCNNCFHKHE